MSENAPLPVRKMGFTTCELTPCKEAKLSQFTVNILLEKDPATMIAVVNDFGEEASKQFAPQVEEAFRRIIRG
jgi:hypothetical protein